MSDSKFKGPNKCHYCEDPAVMSILWAEGRAYIPVCKSHKKKAIHQVTVTNKDEVDKIYPYEEAYRGFGAFLRPERKNSALQEAPEAPYGRADVPRGVGGINTRTGTDIQAIKGPSITKFVGKTVEPKATRVVSSPDGEKQEIPDSLLKMLGKDWKTLRATRVHDNRMTVSIDGVVYSVYTRRG